ncbi:MAG TPA: hypothetical protein VHY09_05075, partial [Candidatus Methylacidiphilales bacterium]|nr:hypothetical protein [Candidatus Methylacidiphilales bacterium]
MFDSPGREMEVLLQYIRAQASARDELQILEAGCGTCWEPELADVPHVLTGVDINADALHDRKFRKRDLHEAVLGDLRTVCL